MNDIRYDYTPDKWAVMYFPKDESKYRLISAWYGGYLGSNSWRVSSGVTGVSIFKNYVVFHNQSGSTYQCFNHCYGLSDLSSNVYAQITEVRSSEVHLLDSDTNWNELNFN